jgi:hypothetical protein
LKGSTLRSLAIAEAVLAVATGLLAILTVFWHDWIEVLTGSDPDHHNGSLEVVIILAVALVSVFCGLSARRSWRLYKTRISV